MYKAEDADPPAIVCVVGKTELRYHLSAIDDLNAMLKKGLRGRFGMYLPPLLEALGLAEVTHEAKNNKMRAK